MSRQEPYHYLSYTLLLFWIALLPAVPLSLSSLLIAILGVKWLLLLLDRSPNRLIKLAAVSLSLVFMKISGLLSFSINGFIHLAALGVFLKFFELQNKNDMLSLLYMLIFVGLTPLLLNQEIIQACLAFLVFLFTLTTLMIINQNSPRNPVQKEGKSIFLHTLIFSFMQLAICLPIMLTLFLIFPRLSPLWAMPDPEKIAKTGLSNRMSPGSIAELVKSNERAFKVNFLNDSGELITDKTSQPEVRELYWRVLTMDRYDGADWHQSETTNRPLRPDNIDYIDAWRYRLFMDKTTSGWLAIFNRPLDHLSIGQWQSDATARLQDSEIASKQSYFVYESKTSYQAYQANPIDSNEYKALLQLPENLNQKTRALTERLRFLDSSSRVSDAQFINNVLAYFARGFIYTLQPPLLIADSQIDQFLFENKQGFCEHYASALAVMARMQGIPARIVNGYLGGTFNPHGGFWEIQQKEAHAWVELYYDNKWRRVDPTAVVSDIRVSEGMDSLIAPSRSFVEKALTTSLFVDLQQRLQAISHFWDQKVLGYDGAAQIRLINRVSKAWEEWRQWFYLALLITTVTIFLLKPRWVLWLFYRFYRQAPVHRRLMNKFDKILCNCLGETSSMLNTIHNMSLSDRKLLVQKGSADYRELSSQFLTEYQRWRFHPRINGITTHEGYRAVIRLKRILRSLSKLNKLRD